VTPNDSHSCSEQIKESSWWKRHKVDSLTNEQWEELDEKTLFMI